MSNTEPVRIPVDLEEKDAVRGLRMIRGESRKTFKSFEKDTKRGEKATKRFTGALAGMKKQILALVGGFTAASVARKAVSNFLIQEKAVIRVTAALKLQGVQSQAAVRGFEDYAAALQKVSIHGDEVILAGMALGLNMGATADQARDLAAAALELSASMNLDLNTAFRQIARTAGGLAGELGEILPEIKALQGSGDLLGGTIRLIRQKFTGSAEALSQTAGGRLTQALNRLGDRLEELGRKLVPAVGFVLESAEFGIGMAGAAPDLATAARLRFNEMIANPLGLQFGATREAREAYFKKQAEKRTREAEKAKGEIQESARVKTVGRTNALLQQAGLRALHSGAAMKQAQGMAGAFGGVSPDQIRKVIEESLSPGARIGRDIEFLQQIQGVIAAREMVPGAGGEFTIGPQRTRIDDMIGGLKRERSMVESPHTAQFASDLGTGINRSVESALRTAFTGGSAREVVDQFSAMLGQSMIETLVQTMTEGLVERSGFSDALMDGLLGLGASEGAAA